MSKRALILGTVAQSLVFQSPASTDYLQSQGYELTFMSAPDEWAGKLQAIGHFRPWHISRRLDLSTAMAGRRAVAAALRLPWDLIQMQTPIASALARSVRPVKSVPSIYVAHGFHFHKDGSRAANLAFRSVEAALAGRTDALAVVCREDFDAAKRAGFHRRTLLWRLPGAGIDLTRFAPSPQGPADPPFVLFCGELNTNKDPMHAVRLVAAARASTHPDLELVIVGSGPMASSLSQYIREGWVAWHPSLQQSDVAALMSQAVLLIAPSTREGLPRVLVEAIASGTPVLARGNRGSRELLTRCDRYGTLLEGDDSHVWLAAMQSLLSDPRPLGGAMAMQKYSEPNFRSVYAELIARLEHRSSLRPGAVDLVGT